MEFKGRELILGSVWKEDTKHREVRSPIPKHTAE
jgi:hypothetical protein